MKITRLLAPALLLGALALAGCSDDPAEFGTDGSSAGSDGQGGGSAEVTSSIDPDDVLTSYEVEHVPRDAPDGSTVTIGVHSLEVQGDVMLLELYYTPNVSGGDPDASWDLYSMSDDNPIRPLLTDRPNLTQYRPVLTEDRVSSWSVEVVGTGAPSGQTVLWWGYYAAPPEGVDTLQLQVDPEHPQIEITVQR